MNLEHEVMELFSGLSRAAARSQLYAMLARQDGRTALAKLFLALAESQTMQARRFLIQARGTIGSTDENESLAFDSELPAVMQEYSRLEELAGSGDNRALATGFRQSSEVIRNILELHDALGSNDADTDYHVCDFCGYIATGDPPDNCPVCTAPRDRFKLIDFAA